MENLGYLGAAYAIIFGVIFLYVIFIQRRQAKLDERMRAMEARLAEVRDHLRRRSAD
ncbi:CcmD family protein [bacterium]|jgi:CcmD family protein|nr:CcmD family protein [bacterium]